MVCVDESVREGLADFQGKVSGFTVSEGIIQIGCLGFFSG